MPAAQPKRIVWASFKTNLYIYTYSIYIYKRQTPIPAFSGDLAEDEAHKPSRNLPQRCLWRLMGKETGCFIGEEEGGNAVLIMVSFSSCPLELEEAGYFLLILLEGWQ